MPKLTTQAGGISLGRALAALSGLATAMVLSRLLSPGDYGTYRQVWLIFFTLAPVLELGVPPSVSFFLPQLPREAIKTYLVQNGLVLLVAGALLAAALLIGSPQIARLFKNPELATLLRAFALFPALTIPFNLTENTLVSLGRAGTAGMVSGGGALLQNVVVLAAFFGGSTLHDTFMLLSAWAILRWTVATAALLYLSRGMRIQWSWPVLRTQLAFALPMGAAAIAGLLTRQLDKIIVSANFTSEQFAVYANGSYEIPLISVLTLSVTAVLVPALVRAHSAGDLDEVRRLWHGAARRMAYLFFPAFVFLFVAAAPLMVLLFSERYAASAAPFRVLVFLLPLRIAFYGAFLRALGKTRPIMITALGAMGISLVLALLLVRTPWLGYLGPAIAATLAAYWAAWYCIRVALRTLRWRWRDFFPWKALAGIMGVALAAALPTALIGRWMADGGAGAQLAVMGLAFGLLYVGIGEATRAARPREWLQAVGDLLRQR